MLKFIQDKENRGFLRFWLAQLISQFGDRVHQMALVGFIAARAPGSSFELAKLLSFTIIPVFIVGPIAGVFVDRWDRKSTLFVTDFIRGGLVLVIAFYAMHFSSPVVLYGLVFLVFTFSRFYVPAKMSFVPEIVKQEDLHVANSLVTVTGMIALVLGALCGGLIVEKLGAQGGFLWDAATYFVAGLLVFSITNIRRWKPSKASIVNNAKQMAARHKNVWQEIKEGIRYIGTQKQIRLIFIMMSILFAASGAIYVVIITFIQKAFGTVTKDLGFMAVPLGVGLFLGSLLYGRFGSKWSRFKTMFISLMLGGVMIAVFALSVEATHQRHVGMGLAFLLGLVCGPTVIAGNTVINQVCDGAMSGKVFASLEFVMHLAFLLAMLLCSYLAEQVAHVWILTSVGAIFVAVGLTGLLNVKENL